MRILDLLGNNAIGIDEGDRSTTDAWRLVYDLESDLGNPDLHDLVALDLADIGYSGVNVELPPYLRDTINGMRDVILSSIRQDMIDHRGKRMMQAVRALRGMGFDWPELAEIERRLNK